MAKTKKVKACVECGSSNIVYEEKEDANYCQDCGAIFEELVPEEEEKLEKSSGVFRKKG